MSKTSSERYVVKFYFGLDDYIGKYSTGYGGQTTDDQSKAYVFDQDTYISTAKKRAFDHGRAVLKSSPSFRGTITGFCVLRLTGRKVMKNVVVAEERWARQYAGKGPSMLLNDAGNMCCLGFATRQVCVERLSLKNITTPGSLVSSAGIVESDVKRLKASGIVFTDAAHDAIARNDLTFAGVTRTEAITEALKKSKLAIRFNKLVNGKRIRYVGN